MTYCPKSTQELSSMLEKVRFPLIVKPRYTFEGNFPGKNATFDEPDTLWRFFAENDVFADAVVQEIIPSGDGDIFVISSYSGADGRVAAMYSGRKIRQYLPDYGATCFGVSEKQPALERETLRFLDNIRYRGWAMVEFAQSRLDGQCYFLELNTRTSWTNQLYADTGVDLTQIGCIEMVGRDFRSVLGQAEQEEGIYWLDFRRDFASIRLKRRQGKITLPAWLRSIVRARSFAQWSWDDPRPFVVACLWRVGDLIQKLLLPRRFRNAEYK
jgi:predicted ATP-grasp superfamily ATP-dependent carboligase